MASGADTFVTAHEAMDDFVVGDGARRASPGMMNERGVDRGLGDRGRTRRCVTRASGLLGLAVGTAACSASSGPSTEVGTYATGGGAGAPGGAGSTGGVPVVIGNGGANSNALRVHVENPQKLTIDTVTLRCAGDCADIQAVARGGNPPYTFAWEDGTTTDTRHVCLDASATLAVTATDTAYRSREFRYDAQTATATITANVLACPPDGGPPPSDTGTPSRGVCLQNPSFEGTPEPVAGFPNTFDAHPWNPCITTNPDYPISTPDIVNDTSAAGNYGAPLPAPTDGATYLGIGFEGPLHELVTQALCAPLLAGGEYSFTIDLATMQPDNSPRLEIYLSGNDCSREALSWTSPPLGTAWTPYCVTLRPSKDATYFTLNPTGAPGARSFVLVDHVVPIERCP